MKPDNFDKAISCWAFSLSDWNCPEVRKDLEEAILAIEERDRLARKLAKNVRAVRHLKFADPRFKRAAVAADELARQLLKEE